MMYLVLTSSFRSGGVSTGAWIALALGTVILIAAAIFLVSYLVARLGQRRPARDPQPPGRGGQT